MSFLVTAKKLISIVDWITQKYENVKGWIKKKCKIHRAKSIRSDVDNRRTGRVRRRIKKIFRRRQNKADGT